MATITVHKLTTSGVMTLRLQVAAVAYHYASGSGTGLRLIGGEALQLRETPDEFELLLDPDFKPIKPAKSKAGKAAAAPELGVGPVVAPPLPLEGPAE